jgi:hypothetical protein
MSIEDHQRMFADPRNAVPALSQLTGDWSGHLILLPTTTDSLLNQVSPVLFQVSFGTQGQQTTAQYQVGPAQFQQTLDAATLQADYRAIDGDTILGKCVAPQIPALDSLHFLLKRV